MYIIYNIYVVLSIYLKSADKYLNLWRDINMDMETLQDNFATLTDVYNTVVDLYNNDGIEQDDDIEDLLNQTKEVIEEVGELDENDLNNESDMIKINDTMVTLLEALGGIVDSMQY